MTLLTETPTVTFAASEFAPRPPEARGLARDEVRLLVGTPDGLDHVRFRDLPDHLRAGDVLVVNDSATVPGEVDATLGGAAVVLHVAARLDEDERVVEVRSAPDAARAVLDASATVPGEVDATLGGAAVVLHVAARLDEDERVVEVRSAPDAARAVLDAGPGDVVQAGDAHLTLLAPWPTGAASSPTGRGNRLWRARVAGPLDDLLARRGRPIAYGYLDGRYPLAAYQTVFGRRPGSAEMASAGRPFTEALVTRLVRSGVLFAPVTLHTGVSSQEAGEAPGPEWFEVSPPTARLVEAARAGGGRVVAVGTTATRAIESAVVHGAVTASRGWTSRVVTPGDPPRVVDGLVTGWHDPHASHLLLVEAVAGRALTQAAYDAAVARGYLWHEFGDAALLLGRRQHPRSLTHPVAPR